jgi:hypothetical protein
MFGAKPPNPPIRLTLDASCRLGWGQFISEIALQVGADPMESHWNKFGDDYRSDRNPPY